MFSTLKQNTYIYNNNVVNADMQSVKNWAEQKPSHLGIGYKRNKLFFMDIPKNASKSINASWWEAEDHDPSNHMNYHLKNIGDAIPVIPLRDPVDRFRKCILELIYIAYEQVDHPGCGSMEEWVFKQFDKWKYFEYQDRFLESHFYRQADHCIGLDLSKCDFVFVDNGKLTEDFKSRYNIDLGFINKTEDNKLKQELYHMYEDQFNQIDDDMIAEVYSLDYQLLDIARGYYNAT
jgi:hypothetical protein